MKRVIAGASLVVIGIALLIANFVSAHPQMDDELSSPKPDEVLSASPDEVRVIFSSGAHDGLVSGWSDIWVVKVNGSSVVAHGGVDLESADRNELVAIIGEPLEAGVYRVEWVAISQGDNGFSKGDYEFAVE